MSSGIDRVGVMVVRIWIEEPSASLRARLTQTFDVGDRVQTTQVAGTSEEIVAIVSDWLDNFQAARRSAS